MKKIHARRNFVNKKNKKAIHLDMKIGYFVAQLVKEK